MKFKKKLFGTLYISVIVLCVLSISFSLAWYNASTHLRIDTIEVNLKSDAELLISTHAKEEGQTTEEYLETFKSHIDYDNDDNLQKVDRFIPVSSMFSNEWLNIKQAKPDFKVCVSNNVDAHGNPTYENFGYGGYGYYSQELYLLCDMDALIGIDSTRYFTDEEKALPVEEFDQLDKHLIRPNKEENLKTAKDRLPGASDDEINKVATELDELAEAMRISILVPDLELPDNYKYYIVDPYRNEKSDAQTELGGILDTVGTGYYDSYNSLDHKAYEVIYGETNERELVVYDDPQGVDNPTTVESPNCFNAKTRANVAHFNYEKSKQNGFKIKDEPSLSLKELEGSDTELKIRVKKNVPQKIVLSLYLEGWDRNCINTNMGGHFLADLSFRIIRHIV